MRCLQALVVSCALVGDAAALWPHPRLAFGQGNGFLRLSDSFRFHLDPLLRTAALQDLQDAVSEALHDLERDRHAVLSPGRGAELRQSVTGALVLHALRLALDDGDDQLSIAENARKPLEQRDESYSLSIDASGNQAEITASTSLGIFRGLQAFTQLVYVLPQRASAQSPPEHEQQVMQSSLQTRFLRAPLCIKDSPAFPWRGVLLDTSRNHYSVEALKKLLNTMSMVAFNQFHWHIVDSHSWPLQLDDFPELSSHEEERYSLAQVAEITAYANARGIDVMLEFDMPGHTGSIGASHIEHVACYNAKPWWRYALEPGAVGQLRIASEATTAFTRQLIESIVRLSRSAYFSTGGDEINMPCFEDDQQTQLDLQGRSVSEALEHFTDKTHDAVRSAGKTPVVWEELAIKQNVRLHKDTIVAIWTNSKKAAPALEKGLRIILAPSDYMYLDCGLGGWLGNPKESSHAQSWCTFNPWHRIYSFDPLAGVSPEQQHLVLGGQVLLWSEQADDTNIEQIFWPRAAAAAEVFWRGGAVGKKRSLSEALPRLHDLRYRMVQRGIAAVPLQPHWCALRPGQCDAPTPELDRPIVQQYVLRRLSASVKGLWALSEALWAW